MDRYLKRLHEEVLAATRVIRPEELLRHPEGKWCAAEVLEHLYLTYTTTAKGFVRCLQAEKPLASAPTWRQRLAITLVAEIGYLPVGRNSPDRVRPRGMPVETVATEIGPQIESMDKLITEAETRFGSGVPLMDHPILGPLTAKQWRKFHWIHGRHHLKQITRLCKGT
jgi:Protein of unknown function (DUF1569)